MYWGINYKCLVSRSVSRYIVHVLHRCSLQSVRSRCHARRHLAVLALKKSISHRNVLYLQIFKAPNYILFTISASGLLSKYSKNFANFSLDILIKRKSVDHFSLHVLFSHFRPHDATLGNSFFQMSSYHMRAASPLLSSAEGEDNKAP